MVLPQKLNKVAIDNESILEKLPATEFERAHRSFIVPINKSEILLNEEVSLTYEQDFLAKINIK